MSQLKIDTLRKKIIAHQAELASVRNAPRPLETNLRALERILEQETAPFAERTELLAELCAVAQNDRALTLDFFESKSFQNSALISLLKKQIIDIVTVAAEQYRAGLPPALASIDREKRMKHLADELLALERQEVEIVRSTPGASLRPDSDVRALLELPDEICDDPELQRYAGDHQ
jgi:hypothetical protein